MPFFSKSNLNSMSLPSPKISLALTLKLQSEVRLDGDSFQQAGVGLENGGWVYGWVSGGGGKNGEAFVKLSPTASRAWIVSGCRVFVTHHLP